MTRSQSRSRGEHNHGGQSPPLATKADLEALRKDGKADLVTQITEVKGEIKRLETKLDVTAEHMATKKDVESLKVWLVSGLLAIALSMLVVAFQITTPDSAVTRAPYSDVYRIQRLAGGHEQAVALGAAEADIGADFRQTNDADGVAVRRDDLYAGPGAGPDVARATSQRMPSAEARSPVVGSTSSAKTRPLRKLSPSTSHTRMSRPAPVFATYSRL